MLPLPLRAGGVNSSSPFIANNAPMGARKLIALIQIAGANPNQPIMTPETAGPTSRAELNCMEFRPTALGNKSCPTISATNDCRAGASKAWTMPSVNAITYTCQSWATSNVTSSASTSELIMSAA